ncbi:MAG: beta-lactamase family protein [Alphaproteobacteria bacterium]|nr:beta-lactamase family protein [Alphaproteobacteria bacterium]MBV9371381.1 beta-lactamase family protein [Alphaproteobacteria bacterium]MBV9901845.1 beta-lactamase family protein [Alphaproteobacteria bacterium]
MLIFALWAATHLRFGKAEPAPRIGITDAELSRIADRQKVKGNAVDYGRIDHRLQALMKAPNMIGLAVGIVEGGQIRFLKGYGETVAGSGDPVTPNTLFRWASVSKGVAADMVSVLAADGKVSLSAPIARYQTTLRLPAGDEYRATVADLLSHRLGLFSHANDSKLEDGVDPHMLRASMAQLNAICSPGTCWAYQNVAYDTASEIVAKATGKSYEESVKERLFLPLGMRTASMNRDALLTAPSWARPYAGTKASKPVEVTDSYYRVPAAGGVNSSIKDLAIWMQAQMGLSPAVIPQRALDAVQTALVPTAQELGRMRKFRERVRTASYGLGWRIYDYAGHRVIAHRGGVRGYRSLIMFDPALKSGVVALWNSSTNQPGGLEFEVMDMIYHLEPHDWLGVDARATPEQPEPEGSGNSSVDAGG